jgi:microcystin-dependent protein
MSSFIINPLGGFLTINSSTTGSNNTINITGDTTINGNCIINGNLDITSANILNTNIKLGNISNATVTYFYQSTIANIQQSNITTGNITTANISASIILSANIIKSNITLANITLANISFANITTANITTVNASTINVQNYLYTSGFILIPAGSIIMWGNTTCPSGYLQCDGNSYSTTLYSSLFSAINYTYGGSGSSFKVPNFNGLMPLGSNSTYQLGNTGGASTMTMSLTQMPSHTHTLSVTAPTHTHTITDPQHSHSISETSHTHSFSTNGTYQLPQDSTYQMNQGGTNNAYYASKSATISISGSTVSSTIGTVSITSTTPSISAATVTTGISATSSSIGSGSSINIINPYLAIYFCIKY